MIGAIEVSAAQFRAAVAAGTYGQAQEALRAYGEAIAAGLRELPEPDRRATLDNVLHTLAWAGRAVRAARSHMAADLDRAAAVSAYGGGARPPATWQLNG